MGPRLLPAGKPHGLHLLLREQRLVFLPIYCAESLATWSRPDSG